MKKTILAKVFLVLALALSHLAVGVGAWNYVDMWWGGRYAGYSAPAWVGLLAAVPFAAGCLICLGLWVLLTKKRAG